jgi:hypothetical protein
MTEYKVNGKTPAPVSNLSIYSYTLIGLVLCLVYAYAIIKAPYEPLGV